VRLTSANKLTTLFFDGVICCCPGGVLLLFEKVIHTIKKKIIHVIQGNCHGGFFFKNSNTN